MNEAAGHGLRELLSPTASASYLESDADEQLLLGIAFLQSVKLFALRFTTSEPNTASAPKTIRLFTDALTIGFDEAATQTPAQEFQLTKNQALGKELVLLRYVKFQKVTSISVFIQDNQEEAETTRLDKLEIFGSLESATAAMTSLRDAGE